MPATPGCCDLPADAVTGTIVPAQPGPVLLGRPTTPNALLADAWKTTPGRARYHRADPGRRWPVAQELPVLHRDAAPDAEGAGCSIPPME
ncbi:hypothetical protein [Streptomyces sp. NPDC042319]|uniref:hypothetical protein n=1 Tax=Streptomyces sp. NPDC042319 TaxID=3154332 RepID=UPI0034054EBB